MVRVMGTFAANSPNPPTGWNLEYESDLTQELGASWINQRVTDGPVIQHSSSFGLGIELTGDNQWAELINSDIVVGPDTFIKALLFMPMSADGEIQNWPAFWTFGTPWPQNGEIDILEGQRGKAALQTHYGVQTSSGGATDNSPSQNAPAGTGGWLTVSCLRQNQEATAWYNDIKLGPVPMPTNANQVLVFQNQVESAGNFMGPVAYPVTAWLSRVAIWTP